MFDEGSWWQPPPHNILTGGMPECLYHTAFDGGLPVERPVVSSFLILNSVEFLC